MLLQWICRVSLARLVAMCRRCTTLENCLSTTSQYIIKPQEKGTAVTVIDRGDFFELHNLPKLLDIEHSLKKIPWMKVKCIRLKKGVTHEVEIKTVSTKR